MRRLSALGVLALCAGAAVLLWVLPSDYRYAALLPLLCLLLHCLPMLLGGDGACHRRDGSHTAAETTHAVPDVNQGRKEP
jgi:hypothetical protein